MSEKIRLAIVEDDLTFRGSLELFFKTEPRYAVRLFKNARELLKEVESIAPADDFDLIITDINMPKMNGLEMIRALPRHYECIVITGNQSFEFARQAVQLSCVKDFIIKGGEISKITESIERVIKERDAETRRVKPAAVDAKNSGFVVDSPALKPAINIATRIAPKDINVLLLGESGSGKEVFARYIHEHSARAGKPFMAKNMTTLSGELLVSELFGHAKGVFTGAESDKMGLFEAANGGSVFLDEIGDMPLDLQPMLLRAIQEKRVMRLGETFERPIDVRFIAATNADLSAKIKEGKFRADLFHRLAEIDIFIPPLRERKEEILPLAEHFLREFDAAKSLGDDAKELLLRYEWFGNIRELQATIKRGIALSDSPIITADDLNLQRRITATR